MIIKSINSKEINNSDEYPKWVKETATSLCFIMISEENVTFIDIDSDNGEDYLEAVNKLKELRSLKPTHPIFIIDKNNKRIVKDYIPTYQLPQSQRPQTFAVHALTELKRISLVESNLQEDVWLSLFNYSSPGSQPGKIIWLGTKENLRQFLDLWYEEETKRKELTFETVKRLVPFCFVYKGDPMYLSKARKEHSHRTDFIENIFRPNENG